MAKESKKTKKIGQFLNTITNRSEAIKNDRCVNPPIGCGGPATNFRDELSQKEYSISGLCQKCQDAIFGGG